ncbi:MAG TPA: SUMF1/EgtB/PvdO family nonheme iron enzyme [Phaeodactylibacter sp.]|nr:SUMF1/EgtB/PvdO family nonheme iron enzyme [Phaeodactylibacter sp.]
MTATLYTESPTVKRHLRPYTANGYPFQMVLVQKGSFLFQGDHKITFKSDFELGQYPVTQGLWQAVMGEPWPHLRFQGAGRPVERVSWDDIMGTKDGKKQEEAKAGFLERLNALPEIAELNATDGCCFGMPSEAQWEYAARGGRYGRALGYEYAGGNYLPEVGWYDENSQGQTQPVGRKRPNALGLYDMSGNVDEWCEDVWLQNYKDAPSDGSAWIKDGAENGRVVRGGSWLLNDYSSRVADRYNLNADFPLNVIGFRLSRYRVTL